MMRLLLWSVAGLLIGLGTHLTTIIILPGLGTQSGFARASAVAPQGQFAIFAPAKAPLPLPDPTLVIALCRYDLASGSIRVHVPMDTGFLSVSFYTPAGLSFYALTDRAAADDAIDLTLFTPAQLADIRAREGPDMPGALRIQAPQQNGLIVLRAIIPEPGMQSDIERSLSAASCALTDSKS